MNKYAIYTVCTGGYDDIKQPLIIDSRFDYFLFTDNNDSITNGIWQKKEIPYNGSNLLRARYAKTHPEELLPKYEATLFLDASVQIVSQWIYERMAELYNEGVDMAGVKHPERDCIYDEAYYVLYGPIGGWENERPTIEWCHKIWKEGFPRHYGLFETGLLYRRNNAVMKSVDELWWKSIITYNQKRDQFSFTYALWNFNPKKGFFLPQGQTVVTSKYVNYKTHTIPKSNKITRKTRWEQLRYDCFNFSNLTKIWSQRIWHNLYKKDNPYLMLLFVSIIAYIYRLLAIIYNNIKHHAK